MIHPTVVEAIRVANQLDLRLHRAAVELFEDRYASAAAKGHIKSLDREGPPHPEVDNSRPAGSTAAPAPPGAVVTSDEF